jgi:hypothetical protein
MARKRKKKLQKNSVSAKTKKIKRNTSMLKIPNNQLENLELWLDYYKSHNKLPHNRVICSKCNISYANLKGIAMVHARKAFDNNIKRILTESLCKDCKPKEKKVYVKKVLTREEMEIRAEEVRRNLPKIDLHKVRERIDMVKNKEVCEEVTSFACWRPDIYLDFGCAECVLVKNCACPIKNLKRKPDGRYKKYTS